MTSSLLTLEVVFGLVSLISLVILLLNFLFNHHFTGGGGDEPFECGFEPMFLTRVPFSFQFFSISVIFLLFDLEVVIMLPLIKIIFFNSGYNSFAILLLFSILLLGLLYEWKEGSFKWVVY